MRRLMVLCSAAVLAACAKKDNASSADTTAMAPPPAATMADMAGKWTVKVMPAASDTTLLTYELTATADTSGWSMVANGQPAIPLRVSPMAGDSVVTEAGPYPSLLRNGVQVWTHNVTRLVGGHLMGTTVAHYSSGADTVVNLRSDGTKAP